ncbi:MAG: hypothetical protein AABY64_05690 [Bdellovibrionota bacterium]
MTKTIGDMKSVNISKVKINFSQNAIGGYLPKAYFIADQSQEQFNSDEKFRPTELTDKGFMVTQRREKAMAACVKEANLALLKFLEGKSGGGLPAGHKGVPKTSQEQRNREPAQAAVNAIEKINESGINNSSSVPGRTFGSLEDREGKKCVGFSCATNPRSQSFVRNGTVKIKQAN